MPDAPAAPTVPVATQAPAAPPASQGATVTPIKPPHHSAQQARAEDGKFAQPAPASSHAPRRIKVAEGVEMEEEELLADYNGRRVEHEAYERAVKERAELAARLEAYKEPHKALTPEQRMEIAKRELADYLAREEEAKLPPAEREQRARARAVAAENERLKEELQKREQGERQAKAQADREHTVGQYRATMKILGVPDDQNGVVSQQVIALMYEAKQKGLEYPPETLAYKVRQRMQGAAAGWVTAGGARGLLSHPGVVGILNSLKPEEHGELLEKLGPFMETARAYNLQRRGLTGAPPGQQPQAPAVVGPGGSAPVGELPVGRDPRTNPEWLAWFRAGNQPRTPAQYQAQQRLKSLDLL